ncbi:MAG: helix-turn-helix transcriptional regulator [Spirochaetaceae bacterium]|nr:helix-turn-helix transcriptional regulator [Spirochaetaceae bacterium]
MDFVIDQIRKLRMEKGVSQLELSHKSGLSQSFLANLEKGKKLPSVLTLIKIADALSLNTCDFFPKTIHPNSQQQVKEQIIELLNDL